jgi:AraC-like DNA-binding protein
MSGSLSIVVLRALDAALAREGGEGDAFLAGLGVPRALLQDDEARLPATLVHRAFARANEVMGDPCFSLRAAGTIPFGTLDLLDFAMRSSPTMREGLRRCVRYFPLIDDCSVLSLEEDGPVARLAVSRKISTSPRSATEFLFAVLLARGRLFTGEEWPLVEVRFLARAPTDAASHARYFGTKVSFAAGRNELVFGAAWLDAPFVTHDADVLAFSDRHAEALLTRVAERTSFLERVRAAVRASPPGVEPPLDVTARRIALSGRTLQRRLEESGTSYRAILDEVRRERALALLGDPHICIAEIGAAVGFGDARAFYRAFRRWTGTTPAMARSEMAARA